MIATYNQARDLPAALESALGQDVGAEAVEFLIVDDGSSDDTAQVLDRYRTRIRLLTQPHRGLAAACNLALAHARGRYVARLDSDDTVSPSWLRRELEVLERHPEACCVYPDIVQVEEDGRRQLLPCPEENLYRLQACGTVFRAEAIRAVGGYRPLFWEEYDLYLRLRAQGTFLHLHEPLYVYRRHAMSMTADAAARRAGWQQLLQLWGRDALLAAGSSSELEDAITAEATS